MISLKKQKGFTLVELLIVIIIIGILATLVIVTFTGVQAKARDSQRQTDIGAVDSHLEAFFAETGYYPSYKDLTTATFLSGSLKGLDPQSLVDPKITDNTLSDATLAADLLNAAADASHYGYVTTGCTTTSATSATNQCASFTLTAVLEGDGSTYTKKSNT